ncbi:MAG: glutamine synthetase [Thermomicrobiales bacterium]|nr:glutamine synthetase [Thermomicrobiales bacterium]MCO5222882.1 glutamine synthetase family protein [Thermomicrobiales bacterium]
MPTAPADPGELLTRLQDDRIENLWITYHDYSGIGAAKTVPPSGFRSAVNDGLVFAKANLEMDILDHFAPGATWLGDSGDILVVPDPRSYSVLPRFPNTAIVNGWMRATDGSEWDGCPRTRLKKVVDELAAEGFSTMAALEPEFYLLEPRENGDWSPINSTRMFTTAGLQEASQFCSDVVAELEAMNVPVGQLGKEYGPGQYEMSVKHGTPFEAIDRYWALKMTVRDLARANGWIASFMPKIYSEWAGNSLHVHLSIWDTDGETDLTLGSEDNEGLSDIGRWFLGGLLAHAPALTGLGSPTVNSYKRLLPGSWAPANIYWGYGNRSGVARIPGVGDRRHIEYRSGDNSCNPALFLTGLLGAGLDGIRKRTEPGEPFQGDVGVMTEAEMRDAGLTFLPRTLPEALEALENDEVVAQAIGETLLPHFLEVKRSELIAYELHVHPWERATYLEVI